MAILAPWDAHRHSAVRLLLPKLQRVRDPVKVPPGSVQLDFPGANLLTEMAWMTVVIGALALAIAVHSVLRLEVVVERPSIALPFEVMASADLAESVSVLDPLEF